MIFIGIIIGLNIGIAIGLFIRLLWFINKVSDTLKP